MFPHALATISSSSSLVILAAFSSVSPVLRRAIGDVIVRGGDRPGGHGLPGGVLLLPLPGAAGHRLPPRPAAKKVVVKTKRIILRRWHRRRPRRRRRTVASCPASAGFKLEKLVDLGDGFEGAFGIGEGCTDGAGGWRQRCFAVDDDDDGMWEALVEQEGLFWFGSFWGRPEQEDPAPGDDGFRPPVALESVRASA
ncbi:hypothetical protein EJB05_19702, partial [Eragrostis curvula]